MFHRAQLRRIGNVTLLAILVSFVVGIFTAPAMAAPPINLEAKSAVLLDYVSGQVLLSKNPDEVIPPASLTKLMTLHIAYKQLEEGKIKRDDLVQVSRVAWWWANPALKDSSLMFLEPGQKVTVGEIMKGVAIPSGNDAAIALAEHIGGSVESFVAMMNDEATAMGYKNMHFVDPAGLSPENKVTAGEFADFARKYIQLHPEALQELHNQKTFTYPLTENLSAEKRANPTETDKPITQDNRNGLLWTFEGVDGLKTGFVDEAGFNIALTAKRGDMRLVAVLLGVAKGASIPVGSARREADGAALLTWGFSNFVTSRPDLPEVKPVRVWKGAASSVTLKPEQEVLLTLEKGTEQSVTATVHQEESVIAPVQAGQKLGEIIFSADGKEVAKFPLVAADEVKQGGFFKRIWDSLRLWVGGLIKKIG